MPTLTLFGSREAPWRTDAWRAVDDRIRGGKSQSHLVAVQRMDGSTFANFYGNLDIKTLGGAGFASQSHTSSYDLSHFNGLSVTLQPTARRDCTTFTITLKTELPQKRKDGRNESVLNYEWDFDASDTMMMNTQDEKEEVREEKMEAGVMMGAKNKTFKAEWKDFKATYRGRPVDPHEAKPLNPAEIKEISIMCRSNFGKQSGSFNIFVSDISAFTSQDKNDNSGPVAFLVKAWKWLKNWFLYIFGLRRDNGQGFIRL